MKNNLIILLFGLSFSLTLISCGGGNTKTETPKKIEVIGSAEMEIVPDEIYVTFTLTEYLDAARRKVKIESIKSDFLKICKEAGIADSNISISSYSGNERWDYYWYRRRKFETDFLSSISYVIKVNSPEELDKLVNTSNDKSIQNFYISKVSHSKIEQLRKDVKTNALIATKNKAEYLAQSIGEELGEALLIQEIDDRYQNYYYESRYSNVISQSNVEYESNNTATTNFKKIKLRYEMKAEFELK